MDTKVKALPTPGVAASWQLQMLVRRLRAIRRGTLDIELPGGAREAASGSEPGPYAKIVIRDAVMVRRCLLRGDLGFAEAYIEGEWDTPNLTDLLELLDRNSDVLDGAAAGRWLRRLGDRLVHLGRRNTRSGARRNIAAHYDLGNAFYQLWLDPSMTYSSAVFETPTESLAVAQRHKYRRILERLDLRPEHRLLEIGSGWGGFAIFAAQEIGCSVVSITLSHEQLTEARARAEAAGVDALIEFRLEDYRDVAEHFDRIVSIEMFEAVGERYWPAYFAALHRCLNPGGRAALQVITIAEPYFRQYRRNVDFIQRYIFPGGMLPSPKVFEARARKAGLQVESPAFFGAHYAQTLAHWDRAFYAARDALDKMGYDRGFRRMWHYYLAYCEAGFRTGHCDLMQTTLVRE